MKVETWDTLRREALIDRGKYGWRWDPAWSEQFPMTVSLHPLEPPSLPPAFAEQLRSLLVAAGSAASILLGILAVLSRGRLKLGPGWLPTVWPAAQWLGDYRCLFRNGTPQPRGSGSFRRETLWNLSGAVPLTPLQEQAPRLWNEVIKGDAFWGALRTSQLHLDPAAISALRRERKSLLHMRVRHIRSNAAIPAVKVFQPTGQARCHGGGGRIDEGVLAALPHRKISER
jgi:hypothetical protein